MQRPVREQQMAGYEQMAPAGHSQRGGQRQSAERAPKKGGAWKVVLQFVVGLAVIAGVAAAIVMLYIRYYQ